jgi:meiotically up-regulated gene 157 (Mug157) protein
MMRQRGALLPGRISTDVELLLHCPQANALMVTSADKGAVRDVTQVENR